eukprot:CAMPEP_0204371840 /NCGR_PEP_ID=MMETSP0469-20131031/46805_1 /ASSEMBLY_ACC=CAM_ASM_000384 /TAXON_ID=2969 /ORGANISM="Oxyrrhis marina" /LENGTH=51 /DNA_ID=CAMNT_0051362017 /DNA_START=38 /DNA_END=193 /DNA_ORIENTATION=-
MVVLVAGADGLLDQSRRAEEIHLEVGEEPVGLPPPLLAFGGEQENGNNAEL